MADATQLLFVTQGTSYVVPTREKTPVERRTETIPPSLVRPQRAHTKVRVAIEVARLQQSLTVGELAHISGVSEDAIRTYESGAAFPSASDLAALQTHLGTKLMP